MHTNLIVGGKLLAGCNTKLHGFHPHFLWHVCVLETNTNVKILHFLVDYIQSLVNAKGFFRYAAITIVKRNTLKATLHHLMSVTHTEHIIQTQYSSRYFLIEEEH